MTALYLDQMERIFVDCLDDMTVSGTVTSKDCLNLYRALEILIRLRREQDAPPVSGDCNMEGEAWPAVPAAE